jgi:hypothetical protein
MIMMEQETRTRIMLAMSGDSSEERRVVVLRGQKSARRRIMFDRTGVSLKEDYNGDGR